jgi:hypothetical protein
VNETVCPFSIGLLEFPGVEGPVGLKCYISNNSRERKKANDGLKVGQKVKVCGEAEFDEAGKIVTISSWGSRLVTVAR